MYKYQIETKELAYQRLRMSQRDVSEEDIAKFDEKTIPKLEKLTDTQKGKLSNRVYGWLNSFYPDLFPEKEETKDGAS